MRLVDAVFARIKELMKEKGMSMYRLAMNGGVPRSTIATIPLSETVTLLQFTAFAKDSRSRCKNFSIHRSLTKTK